MSVADINFGCLFQEHVGGERIAAIDVALPGEPREVFSLPETPLSGTNKIDRVTLRRCAEETQSNAGS